MGHGRALAVLASMGLVLGSGSAEALNLDNISIVVTEVEPASIFSFRLDAEGAMITDVTVTPPVGEPISLICVDLPIDDCNYVEEFSSLDDLKAKFPEGSYLFEFNSSASSISLTHAGFSPPTDFVDVVYSPVLGESTTSTTPTFSWMCPAGCVAATQLGIEMEDAVGEVFSASYIPPFAGSITLPSGPFIPPPTDLEGAFASLTLGETYSLWSSIENLSISAETLGASDTFEYGDESIRESLVEFTVVPEPEPTTAALIALGAVGLLAAVLHRPG